MRAEDGSLYVMMLNTSGGLVGGDRLLTEVELGPKAEALLITASAAKAYRTNGTPSIQDTVVRMKQGATLEYLPDHLIPHPDSIIHQSLKVEMEPGCRAMIYDAIAAGRIARGERWNFKELKMETSISLESRPAYISRSLITPDSEPLHRIGWMQSYSYLATIVIVGPAESDWTALSSELNRVLEKCLGISGGVSCISHGTVVRFMASSAVALSSAKRNVWNIGRRFLLGLDAFELRKY